jgi:tripartite-type tricarboxylate transporter receptor subunit TctC
MNRREVLQIGGRSLASAALATTAWPMLSPSPARASEWPSRTVRVIVPYAAGSATDLVPRTVFEAVSAEVGQSIVVDNRLGGGTTVGTSAAAKAEPDGYTILVHSNGLVTVPAIQPNVPYDPVRDFAGITPLGNVPLVLVTATEKNIKTVQQLVSAAKAKPGSINYAAAGIGTPPHLTAERFRLAAGFEGQLVPFKGAPEALTEVLAGRVDLSDPRRAALHQRRQAHGIGGEQRQARLGVAACSDHARIGLSRFRFRLLGRRARAQADPP